MRVPQNKTFPIKSTLNCGGKLLDLSTPKIMGILNVTPDSFYDGGKYSKVDQALVIAEKHLEAGADILDIGAVSTRPKSEPVIEEIEMGRLIPVIDAIIQRFPNAIISADTYRASVAQKAAEAGAKMINDISGGTLDANMFRTIAQLRLPYVMMHIQGTPKNMQENPTYDSVLKEVFDFFLERCHELESMGAKDIVIDLGYGFGKTLGHNYKLLNGMTQFHSIGYPILAGLSRKSMINKVLGISPSEALNGTTALNMVALSRGANILRVHDVLEAKECIKLAYNIT